jgi:hypothetical protein
MNAVGAPPVQALRLADLSPERVTALLSDARLCSGRIAAITSEPIGAGVGLMSQLSRLRLEWADGDGPRSLIVKCTPEPGVSRSTGIALRMFARESAFYATLGGGPRWRSPACFGAAFDPATHDHLIVLEDLGAGRFGDTLAGIAPADARHVMGALADVHAASWDAGQRPDVAAFQRVDDPDLLAMFCSQYPAWWAKALRVVGEDFPTATRALFAELPAHVPLAAGFLAAGELAVGHGDTRGDNIAFDVAGRRAVLFDWQMVDLSRPGRDIGYFLTQSMQPHDRRAHFDELLDVYSERLLANGVALERDRLILETRAGALLTAMYGIGAFAAVDDTHPRVTAVAIAQSVRSAAAIEDLDLASVPEEIRSLTA